MPMPARPAPRCADRNARLRGRRGSRTGRLSALRRRSAAQSPVQGTARFAERFETAGATRSVRPLIRQSICARDCCGILLLRRSHTPAFDALRPTARTPSISVCWTCSEPTRTRGINDCRATTAQAVLRFCATPRSTLTSRIQWASLTASLSHHVAVLDERIRL